MPGFLLHAGATVLCSHAGQATPVVPNPRVLVSGQPTALLPDPWLVAGCPGIPPSIPPCVSGQWIVGSTRVFSNSMPLVIAGGTGIGVPPGTPLLAVIMQTRVNAT
jgi:hypothetical protein